MGLHRAQGLLPDRLVKEVEDQTQCKGVKTMGGTVMEVLRGARCRLREGIRFDLQSSMIPELRELKGFEVMIIWISKNHMRNLQIRWIGRRSSVCKFP